MGTEAKDGKRNGGNTMMGKLLFFLLVFDRLISLFKFNRRKPKTPFITPRAGWINLAHRLFKKSRCPGWDKRRRKEKEVEMLIRRSGSLE